MLCFAAETGRHGVLTGEPYPENERINLDYMRLIECGLPVTCKCIPTYIAIHSGAALLELRRIQDHLRVHRDLFWSSP